MREEDGYFGEGVAATYDEPGVGKFEPAVVEPTVDFLAELAGTGRALELGIGTGRIAVPLAARGVEVHGIDLSRAMVSRLRGKPGGDAIPVTIGDFATAKADGTFRLVYLVFNTIGNLTRRRNRSPASGTRLPISSLAALLSSRSASRSSVACRRESGS
jgi:SAM-dependent methyltransferase